MVESHSLEMPVNFYRTTRLHIPEDSTPDRNIFHKIEAVGGGVRSHLSQQPEHGLRNLSAEKYFPCPFLSPL
jgi:hypothetical protein